ncbi:MAG: tetratricopeptide repeat protein [Gammaproteobacteria bacterium]|nr:tetratricopeptide repeat protein [Gammaproteobacteria bacterium]
MLFTGLSVWQQRIAEAARLEAERATAKAQQERDRADEIAGFLAGLFDAAKPRQTLGEEVSATDLLDLGVRQLEASDEDPGLKADLLETIAGVYQNLGEWEEGLRLAERAVALKEAAYGPDSLEMASALSVLSRLYNETGDGARAAKAVERAFEIQVAPWATCTTTPWRR